MGALDEEEEPTSLAVIAHCLTTVEPYTLCIIHGDCEATAARRRFLGHEARKEATGERVAGISEGRLGDRVVLWEEVEFNLSADLSDKVVRAILKHSVFADSDFDSHPLLGVGGSCRESGKTKEGVGELHYEKFAE